MKAVSLQAPGEVFVKEIAEPVCQPDQIKVKVKSVGICGSDVAAYLGKSPLVSYPIIIGHEIAGEIVEINSNQNGLNKGDFVILEPYIYCNECYPCSLDRTNCCQNLEVLGVHIDGGMCEYICHPAHLVHKLPDSISLEEAPLIEPLVISYHAVDRLKLKSGEYVVIMGAGPIGNLAAQLALNLGAIPIVVDLLDERLEIVQSLGTKYAINPAKEDLVKTVEQITKGQLAECVIEATGASAAIRSTLDVVSFAGRIALIGWPKEEVSLPTRLITFKELDIVGSRNSKGRFQSAISLVADKKVDLKAITSKVVGIDELPASLIDQSEKPADYLKIVGLF